VSAAGTEVVEVEVEAEIGADCVEIDVAAAEWVEEVVGNPFLQMATPSNPVHASAAISQRQVVGGEEQPHRQGRLVVGGVAEARIHIQTGSVAA